MLKLVLSGILSSRRGSAEGASFRRSADTAQVRATALTQSLESDIEHRNDEQPDRTCGDHAGEHRRADIMAADLGGALGDD